MAKKILIMRHAKSSWEYTNLRDFDRPLNKRGNRDAPRMGNYLKELDVVPDQIVSSTAKRAKNTIQLVSEVLDFNAGSILWDEDLYFKGGKAYIDAIRRMSEKSKTVMAIGHYPMVDEVVSFLSGKQPVKHFATATIACLETEAQHWSEIDAGCCTLLWMVKPKELAGEQ